MAFIGGNILRGVGVYLKGGFILGLNEEKYRNVLVRLNLS